MPIRIARYPYILSKFILRLLTRLFFLPNNSKRKQIKPIIISIILYSNVLPIFQFVLPQLSAIH